MYSCVMGMTEAEGEGCILADEMGLGKTLSAIALVYTMLSKSTSTVLLLTTQDNHLSRRIPPGEFSYQTFQDMLIW
jgi:SNF2 family DNA or RNA helicase